MPHVINSKALLERAIIRTNQAVEAAEQNPNSEVCRKTVRLAIRNERQVRAIHIRRTAEDLFDN